MEAIIAKGDAKDIAALVLELQERQTDGKRGPVDIMVDAFRSTTHGTDEEA